MDSPFHWPCTTKNSVCIARQADMLYLMLNIMHTLGRDITILYVLIHNAPSNRTRLRLQHAPCITAREIVHALD